MWLNIKESPYFASGEGVEDDTPAFKAAIRDLRRRGGVIHVPAGRYRLTERLLVQKQIIIQGEGWSRNDNDLEGGASMSCGTWLFFDVNAGPIDADTLEQVTVFGHRTIDNICHDNTPGANGDALINISGGASGSVIRDLAISVRQPEFATEAIWLPADLPYAIYVECEDVLILNIKLYNVTRGIYVRCGRVTISRVFGQAILMGLKIHTPFARDVVRVSDVHWFPFWQNGTEGFGGRVREITRTCGISYYIGVADNGICNGLFSLGYACGMIVRYEEAWDGEKLVWTPVNKLHLSNIDFDSCIHGLVVLGRGEGGEFHTLQCCNLTLQGDGTVGAVGIYAEKAQMSLSCVRVTFFMQYSIVAARGCRLQLNCLFQDHCGDRSEDGIAAIEAWQGGIVWIDETWDTLSSTKMATYCDNASGTSINRVIDVKHTASHRVIQLPPDVTWEPKPNA